MAWVLDLVHWKVMQIWNDPREIRGFPVRWMKWLLRELEAYESRMKELTPCQIVDIRGSWSRWKMMLPQRNRHVTRSDLGDGHGELRS